MKIVETSFKDNSGIEKLLKALSEITDEEFIEVNLHIGLSESKIISDLSRNGWLRGVEYQEDSILVLARLPKTRLEQYSRFIKNDK